MTILGVGRSMVRSISTRVAELLRGIVCSPNGFKQIANTRLEGGRSGRSQRNENHEARIELRIY
jgi:hypothetical protein